MIAFISGTIQAISDKYAIIDVNGVGYRITMSAKNLNSIAKIGERVKLFTHYQTNPRDGSVELYGFTTLEELNFFELLTSVSGIGPKSAQTILSSADLQTLQIGIIRGDDDYLRKVAGLGEKTAARLVLELKNKIMSADIGMQAAGAGSDGEAIDALVTLGYSQFQARDILKQVAKTAETAEEKIKEALKLLGTKK